MHHKTLTFLILLLTGSSYAQNGFYADTLNDTGIWVSRRGQGLPTIVLEAGFGGGIQSWQELIPYLEGHTSVVAYDRAGLGKSMPPAGARTPARIARELNALLDRIGASPPYLLVGHSAGAVHVRAFSRIYPEKVAAIALIEPTTSAWWQYLKKTYPDDWQAFEQQRQEIRRTGPFGIKAEDRAFERGLHKEEKHNLPDIPTLIITAAGNGKKTDEMGASAVDRQKAFEINGHLLDNHAPSNRAHLFLANSGHKAQTDQPAFVAAAILQLLDQLRR